MEGDFICEMLIGWWWRVCSEAQVFDLCRRQPFDGYSIIFYDFLWSGNCILWFNMFSMVFSMAFLCFVDGFSMVYFYDFYMVFYDFLWFLYIFS